jgi:hypothetical protein
MKKQIGDMVEATLEWCNEMRAKKGKKPLKELPLGRKGDPMSCPCGKTTGLAVGMNNYGANEQGVIDNQRCGINELPDPVKQFVRCFDDGGLPQYDIDNDK